jgi:hypothetical protein
MTEAAAAAADSEGLVSAMLRAKWNKTKYDAMDAVADAQDHGRRLLSPDMMEADSYGIGMLRAKWNKTKHDLMDAVEDAKDLDAASEDFMIASLMKKLSALKGNETKFAGPASDDHELLLGFLLGHKACARRSARLG